MAKKNRVPEHAVEIPPQGFGGPGTTLLSIRQISQHLGVSRSTIKRLVEGGEIPYSRVGRQYRFDLLAVRAVIDRQR